MGGKSSTPAAPDYTGAANAQAAASQELATQQTWANRPNQYTPWGSTTWNASVGTDPATGQPITQWDQRQSLDPALQQALNDQLNIQGGKSDLANQFMGRVGEEYSRPFDWTNLPGMAGTPQAQMTQGRQMQTGVPQYQLDARYNQPTTQSTQAPELVAERHRIEQGLFDQMAPIHQQQTAQLQQSLANQGLTPGSEAYNAELARLQQQQSGERFNALKMGGQEQQLQQGMMLGQQQQAFGQRGQAQDQYNQALMNQFGQGLQAGQFGNQAQQQMFQQDLGANQQNYAQMMQSSEYQNRLRQQAIAEQAQARGMSLNEMNALLTGQQVQNPQIPSFMGAQAGQAPNLLGAAQAQGQYNLAGMNAENQQSAGLWGGLGSMAGTAAMMY